MAEEAVLQNGLPTLTRSRREDDGAPLLIVHHSFCCALQNVERGPCVGLECCVELQRTLAFTQSL